MKVRDIKKRLESEGWYFARQKGSQKIYKHPQKPGIRIVLPDHGDNKEPSIGVMKDIEKRAGWE